MLKKFAEGMVFGCGFAIAFVAILYFGTSFFILPNIFKSDVSPSLGFKTPLFNHSQLLTETPPTRPFRELDLEQQIKQSSVIAITRYEPGDDGDQKAIITEILKQAPNTAFYYNIGDEYKPSSYYPRSNIQYGDGTVVFFIGSPALMRMSMSYSGNRIHSLGDLPIELLRKKCKGKSS